MRRAAIAANNARLSEPHVVQLVSALRVPPNGHVLDVGYGNGELTLEIMKRLGPGIQMTALDVRRAKNDRLNGSGVRFVRGSVFELPFDDDTFDAVYANLVFYTFARPHQQQLAAQEMLRVTRPGGWVVVADVDCSLCFEHLVPTREPDGWDYFVGRKLPALLKGAGAVEVGGAINIALDLAGTQPNTWSYNSKCGSVIAWGRKSPAP